MSLERGRRVEGGELHTPYTLETPSGETTEKQWLRSVLRASFQTAAQKLEAKVNLDCTLPLILVELQLPQFTSPDVSAFTSTPSSAYRTQLLSKHSSTQKLE